MTPELESQARDALARVLTRDDFPAVLVDPVSTYLVTGKAHNMSVRDVYVSKVFDVISPRIYTRVYWLLYYLGKNAANDVEYYVRELRLHFNLHDS